jgi:hypothetical protein
MSGFLESYGLMPSSKFVEGYKRLFRIHEIESTPVLQWMFGAMLFFFFLTFQSWDNNFSVTVEGAKSGAAVCWPYFQSCTNLFFLHSLPYGYSETTFYMLLYGLMLLTVYCIWRKMWAGAHALMVTLLAWELFVGFVLSYDLMGPYNYYHVILCIVLLFLPLKEYFLKLAFVFCYFISVTIKFDPAWDVGTYFSTLQLGLPLIPRELIPLATSIVIFMQVVGAWFLLSSRRMWQRVALTFFIFFHLYSGIFVAYFYPSISLPPLIILFGPMYRYQPPPRSKRSIAGWVFLALLLVWQLAPYAVEGDRRVTLEENRIGMFMFEANHECRATVTVYESTSTSTTSDKITQSQPGTFCSDTICTTLTDTHVQSGEKTIERQYESGSAWNRCDPYVIWFQYQTVCRQPNVQKISFVFDHSVDGGPFYRIVDLDNLCDVTYKPWGHNDWILLPSASTADKPQAEIVGYPVEDNYRY